jgi:hypothetical protein
VKTVLTADVLAHGIIAAAQVLGVDPVKAVQVQRGGSRAAVTVAALALHETGGVGVRRAAAVFGLVATSLSRLKRERGALANRAVKAASRAMIAAGLDLSGDAEDRTDARGDGTCLAPPPVAVNSAPPPAPRVDHTPAIREALARRKGIQMTVAGVETDALLLPRPGKGGCGFPMGDPRSSDYRACDEEKVVGRRYCARHLKASGLKADPVEPATVGRVAAPYGEDAA